MWLNPVCLFFNLNVLKKKFSNKIIAKDVKGILVDTGLSPDSSTCRWTPTLQNPG